MGPLISLLLKRASASRPSGEWNEDDYDVLEDGAVVGRIFKVHAAPIDSPWMWTLAFWHRGPHADTWLRGNARGRYGGICEGRESPKRVHAAAKAAEAAAPEVHRSRYRRPRRCLSSSSINGAGSSHLLPVSTSASARISLQTRC
jgi:hypothetical protein